MNLTTQNIDKIFNFQQILELCDQVNLELEHTKTPAKVLKIDRNELDERDVFKRKILRSNSSLNSPTVNCGQFDFDRLNKEANERQVEMKIVTRSFCKNVRHRGPKCRI